ncbi:CBS domain-containing protein [Paenibacillus sp. FA6]|uniref:CBS domain-containing protein n=1 Tax=Paenibacillus sp. FA6 TaxID=3413029 RepID=UPI003F65542F
MTAIVLYKRPQLVTKDDQSLSFYLLSKFIQDSPHVYTNQKCKDTLRVLFAHPEAECIVVCNEADQPVGLVNCSKFYLRLIGPMGMDSLYMEPVTKLMNRNPLIVEEGTHVQSIREELDRRQEHSLGEYIMMTKQGKLSGVLKVSDLLSL